MLAISSARKRDGKTLVKIYGTSAHTYIPVHIAVVLYHFNYKQHMHRAAYAPINFNSIHFLVCLILIAFITPNEMKIGKVSQHHTSKNAKHTSLDGKQKTSIKTANILLFFVVLFKLIY